MTDQHVPEEAVEAAAQGMFDLWSKPGRPTSIDRAEADAAISAALPAIHKARDAELRERLEGLMAELNAGGDAERDTDEPGVPSSVYYHAAELVRERFLAIFEEDSDELSRRQDQESPYLAALREINEYDVSPEVQKILDIALLGEDGDG